MKREANYKKNVFSYTSISDFLRCPFYYKLIYIDKIEKKITPEMQRGIEIHKLCEKIWQFKDPEEVKNYMVNKGYNDNDIIKGIKYAEYFVDKNIAIIDGKECVEFYKKIKIAKGQYLEAHIDNIHFTLAGTLRIMDIKTGGNIYTKEQLQNNLQLNLYAYIFSTILPATDIQIGIWYWDYGYNVFVNYTPDQNIINKLQATIKKIKETKEWIKTANTYCADCPVFGKCKPVAISEDYAYCKEMEKFWKEKAEQKKIELLNKMKTIGIDVMKDKEYEYYIVKKEFTEIDRDDLIAKVNDINILKEYLKPTKTDLFELKQKGIEIKEIPTKTIEELRYKKTLGGDE